MVSLKPFVALGSVALILSACASAVSSSSPSDAGTDDGGATVDAGAPAEGGVDGSYENVYPAPHAAMPLVAPQAGFSASILANPKLVTIGYDSDTARQNLETFTDTLAGSDWWTATTSEYCQGQGGPCIGKPTIVAHVSLPTAPASLSPAEVETYLNGLIASGTVPAPTTDVIYTFFFPSSVKLGEPGFEGCQAFDGYHSMTGMLGGGGGGGTPDGGDQDAGPIPNVAYAVVARCTNNISESTITIAHELIEAATDPDGYGYTVSDPAWGAFFYPEVGDLCDYEPMNKVGSYTVQSGFSNAAAKAGKNPCVPAVPGELYFNAAPAKSHVKLAVGESIQIAVMPYSEKGAGEFTLDVTDVDSLYGRPAKVEATVDQDTVHNGLPVTLTVKLVAQPGTLNNGQRAAVVALRSTQGKVSHYWPLLVAPK